MIFNISQFPVQKYAIKLTKRKTAANSCYVLVFDVVVFEVLGISFWTPEKRLSFAPPYYGNKERMSRFRALLRMA